jgi:hypothetical protein
MDVSAESDGDIVFAARDQARHYKAFHAHAFNNDAVLFVALIGYVR